MENECIDFFADYGKWIAIKRMSVRSETKPEEVAFHLASIRQSIDKKIYEAAGIDTTALDSYAESVVSGSRKQFSALGERLAELSSEKDREAVRKASGGKKELDGAAEGYLFRTVVQKMGFDLDVSQEMLSKAYPYLKVPKQRGRKAKQ